MVKAKHVKNLGFLCVLVFLAGCRQKTCLPIPLTDETAPHAGLSVQYIENSSSQMRTVTLTQDDPTLSIDADASAEITVTFMGSDDEGVKSIQLIAIRQKTVGSGVERASLNLNPVVSRCPVARMERSTVLRPHQGQKSFSLAMMTENWVGQRSFTENLFIRLHYTEQ